MSNSARRPSALLSVRQVSQLLHISERTVRRRIADGQYVRVKFSPRRIRIDAARSVALMSGRDLRDEITIAELLERARRDRRAEAERDRHRRRNRERQIARAVDEFCQRFQGKHVDADDDLFYSVRWMAMLLGRPTRALYSDISKDALARYRAENFRDAVTRALAGRYSWIRWTDALVYVRPCEAAVRLLADVISGMVNRRMRVFVRGLAART